MSIDVGIWVGFSALSVVAIVGYLVVLCVRYSRRASVADHLLSLFKDDREGIYKRIEEARELQNVVQVCVKEGHAMPSVLSWAYSHASSADARRITFSNLEFLAGLRENK